MDVVKSDFVSAVVQGLIERFKSIAVEGVDFDAKEELLKLHEKLLSAQGWLESYQPTPDNASQHWVGEVARVCYDIEDLIDDMMLDANNTSVIGSFMSFFTGGSKSRKSQKLLDRMEDVLRGLALNVKTRTLQQQGQGRCLKGEVLPVGGEIVGRDEDRESIVTLLLQNTVCSVSIVGMPGLGKTVLARHVLQDSRIIDTFDSVFWITVCAHFDLLDITNTILRQMVKGEPSMKKTRLASQHTFNCNHLRNFFHDMFQGKNVVIVLDDLWNVKHEDWNSFCYIFLNSPNNKVLVTTYNPKVALVTKSSPYLLQLMRDEDCRALFLGRALSGRNMSERERVILLEIGTAMASKCKGLPLAAKFLGLDLSLKPSEDWRSLSERNIFDFRIFKEELVPSFRLFNPNLASHLQRCFAYCSLFPEGYKYEKQTLVRLWMAEGFIHSSGTTSLEDIGNEYFEDLLARSIFQFSDVGDSKSPVYKIHDFIRWFAEYLGSNLCLRLEEDTLTASTFLQKVRHLSLLSSTIPTSLLKDIEKCESLRSFHLLNENDANIGKVSHSLFEKLWRLRVLNLSHTNVDKLPESISSLKRLRYLNVSKTCIKRLPESTSDLRALQVLKVRNCPQLLKLPTNIKRLTDLQELDVDMKKLKCLPTGLGSLSCLRTLPGFVVGRSKGNRITELKNMSFLRGAICISGLQKVNDGAEASEALLSEKPDIDRLELEWEHYSEDGSSAKSILVGLKPYKNLKELVVKNYAGLSFPYWLTDPSSKLVSIHLQNCLQYDVLPSLGQLRFLKTLHLEGMDNVKRVESHFCGGGTSEGFPLLETLKIKQMKSLIIWCLPDNSMCQLQHLTIEDCPRLFSVSSLHQMASLETLEINLCPELNFLPDLPTSLKSLIILESAVVARECQPQNGSKWLAIKDIPELEIDY